MYSFYFQLLQSFYCTVQAGLKLTKFPRLNLSLWSLASFLQLELKTQTGTADYADPGDQTQGLARAGWAPYPLSYIPKPGIHILQL